MAYVQAAYWRYNSTVRCTDVDVAIAVTELRDLPWVQIETDRLLTFPVYGHSAGKVGRLRNDSEERRPKLNGGTVIRNRTADAVTVPLCVMSKPRVCHVSALIALKGHKTP
jgi:hypothetical protein